MKKFILNLLTILTWIYQVICVLGVIFGIGTVGVGLFGLSNADFRDGFRVGLGVHNISDIQLIWLIVGLGMLFMVMAIAEFLICRYARLIVKNIKQEIYFAAKNLQLLKKLLISVACYTVGSIIDYVIIACNHELANAQTQNYVYPNGITNGLLFLAVLYVVYLVFKYGMKVQKDSDSII